MFLQIESNTMHRHCILFTLDFLELREFRKGYVESNRGSSGSFSATSVTVSPYTSLFYIRSCLKLYLKNQRLHQNMPDCLFSKWLSKHIQYRKEWRLVLLLTGPLPFHHKKSFAIIVLLIGMRDKVKPKTQWNSLLISNVMSKALFSHSRVNAIIIMMRLIHLLKGQK